MRTLAALAALLLAACDEVPVPPCADMRPADLASTAPDLATAPDMSGMSDMGCADMEKDADGVVLPACCAQAVDRK